MKLSREELEGIRGDQVNEFLTQRRYRLGTCPFGARPGQVVAFVGRAVPWKERGKVPKALHKA